MMNCDPFHIFKCYIYSDHKYKAVFHLEQLRRGMSNFPFFLFPNHLLISTRDVKIFLTSLKFIMFHNILPK